MRQWEARQLGWTVARKRESLERVLATGDVATLQCSDHVKGIIQRSIGPESGRYPTAAEFVVALQSRPQELRFQSLTTLRGASVVFTGTLSIPRERARLLARRAGATVASSVTASTTVVVLGKPSAVYGAGSRGRKLLDLERLRGAGHRIELINEATFLRAVRQR